MRRRRKNVKKYLGQIKALEIKIAQKQEQLRQMKLRATAGGAIRYDKENVISSVLPDKMASDVTEYIDLEREINADILAYEKTKNRIINEIQAMDDQRHISILYKTYVQHKGIFRISDEMHYSVDHTKHLLADALDKFEETMK